MLFGAGVAVVLGCLLAVCPPRLAAAIEWSILLALCWIISQIL